MHDLIIIGSGPSGFGASIYASRYKLKHLIIGSEIGGKIIKTTKIENWPGFESISGAELMQKIKNQAEKLGAEIIQKEAKKIDKKENFFEISTSDGEKYQSKAAILALGMKSRKLNVPGEDKFIGRGVSYCAICDAIFFRGKKVVVIGGGDSAAKAALHLGEFAEKISIFYPEGNLLMEPAWQEKIKKNKKIEMNKCQEIIEIKGEDKISGMVYKAQGEKKEIPAEGVFVEIGSMPETEIAKKIGVETNQEGFIIVKPDQSTNLSGVYAAGDATTGSNGLRQLITAFAEGAIAASSVYKRKLDNQ